MALVDVSFRTGIDLSKQRLPSGADYLYLPNAESALRTARSTITEWRDLELRKGALTVITVLERELRGNQVQLFLNVNNFAPELGAAAVAVLSLLSSQVVANH